MEIGSTASAVSYLLGKQVALIEVHSANKVFL